MEAIELKANNLNLTAYLIAQQRERDRALGINYPGSYTRLLAWYYQVLQKEQMGDAFRAGVLQRAREKMAVIIAEAETATLDRQKELLVQALDLEEIVNRLIK